MLRDELLWIRLERAVTLAVLVLLVPCGACFAPDYPQGIPCSGRQTCPPGQACDVNNVCRVTALPPPNVDPDAAPDSPDARPDAEPAPVCPSCGEHASCETGPDTAQCVCDAGYAGDGIDCEDVDECALALDDCADNADCGNLPGLYTCTCTPGFFGDGTSCRLPLSCAELLALAPATPSGSYAIDPDGEGPRDALDVTCDMDTDGGGWTRLFFWDRERDPATHTLASFVALFVDEIAELNDPTITAMTALTQIANGIHWADVNATFDLLSFRFEVFVPNAGELRMDTHYVGTSMEESAFWLYASAGGQEHNAVCWADVATSQRYSPAERALIPYDCPLGIGDGVNFSFDGEAVIGTGAEITAMRMRSMHGDSNADSSDLFRLGLWVR